MPFIIKKSIAVLTVVLLLASCAAEKSDELADFCSVPFSMTADYEYNGLCGALELDYTSFSSCDVVFLSPENLASLEVSIRENEAHVSYMGLERTLALDELSESFPVSAFLRLMREIVRDSNSPEDDGFARSERGEGRSEYKNESGDTLEFLEGIPVRISLARAGLTLDITEFSFSGD